jgi:hypothetical protein
MMDWMKARAHYAAMGGGPATWRQFLYWIAGTPAGWGDLRRPAARSCAVLMTFKSG